jgi:hypothetical protein
MEEGVINTNELPDYRKSPNSPLTTVESHKKDGLIKWDPSKVELYFSEEQKRGEEVSWTKLFNEVKNMRVMNDTVLFHLLRNHRLIPQEWIDYARNAENNERAYIFWGTVSCYNGNHTFVRCLIINARRPDRCRWDYISCIENGLNNIGPNYATVLLKK